MSNTGFFNNGVDGRYRISGYNKEDSSILYIFDIDAFIYTSETEKSITGTVYLMKGKEVTATYKDVTFAYNAKSPTSN